jgi:hypothetical protein
VVALLAFSVFHVSYQETHPAYVTFTIIPVFEGNNC